MMIATSKRAKEKKNRTLNVHHHLIFTRTLPRMGWCVMVGRLWIRVCWSLVFFRNFLVYSMIVVTMVKFKSIELKEAIENHNKKKIKLKIALSKPTLNDVESLVVFVAWQRSESGTDTFSAITIFALLFVRVHRTYQRGGANRLVKHQTTGELEWIGFGR